MLKFQKTIFLGILFLLPFLKACANSPKFNENDNPSFNYDEETYCMIDVRGEVMYPNIYKIASGSLIYDAIELAGGVTINADLTNINLVSIITTNMQIFIPKKASLESSKVNDKININSCSIEELLTIPKIGLVKAQAIIEYRNQNGWFTKLEDLKNVKGIGDSLFEEIKTYITI